MLRSEMNLASKLGTGSDREIAFLEIWDKVGLKTRDRVGLEITLA